MKINRLQASFGNLNNRELRLNNGLNIIQAPNESGKSTWCAFIRSILFGLSSERQRIGFLPDKTRYQPWNGAPMEGTADITFREQNITISRRSAGRTPFSNFSATYTGTAEKVDWLTAESAGEIFTGVPYDVFARSAFIGQSSLRVTPSASLEKRMASLVTAGDETASFSQTYDRLKNRRNALRHNRTGSIPVAQAQLAAAQKQLTSLTEKEELSLRQREEIRQLEQQIRQLQKEIVGCDMQQQATLKNELFSAEEKAKQLRRSTSALAASLPGGSTTVSWQKLADVQARKDTVSELQVSALAAEKDHAQKNALKLQWLGRLQGHPFHEMDPSRIEADAETVKQYELHPPAKLHLSAFLRILIFFAGIVLSASCAIFLYPWGLVGGLILICLDIFFCFFLKLKPEDHSSFIEILHKYDAGSSEDILEKLRIYRDLQKQYREAETATLAASQTLLSARNSAIQATERLNHALIEISADENSADARIKELQTQLFEYEQQILHLHEAENQVQTLRHRLQMMPKEMTDYSAPSDTKEELQLRLNHTETRLAYIRQEYNINIGQLHALGDPSAIKSEISALEQQIAGMEAQYTALSIAMETMEAAEKDMRTRFSPMISEAAAKYMMRMTDGRYSSLAFSNDFYATAKTVNDAAPHSSLSLSAGTADQMYLSLRLAISQLILDGEETCPLVLDDALAFFDDERTRDALELLYEISQQKQVLLFTCHAREGSYMQGRPGVTVIREECC